MITSEFTRKELTAFACAVGETLEAVEDWEFQTRTGFTREEFLLLLKKLNGLLQDLEER